MKEILLKVGEDTMLITLNEGQGSIVSSLSEDCNDDDLKEMFDVMESMVLAHACAGVDVQSKPYLQGLETTLEAICNNA